MDFGLLDLRRASEQEYWVQLRVGDTLLKTDDDKPCRVKVASIGEPGVEDAIKAVTRVGRLSQQIEAQMALAPNVKEREVIAKRLDTVEKEAERCLTTFLIKAVRGWENIFVGGEEVKFSQSALADMAEPKAPLFRLAASIAADMAEVQDPLGKRESA